MKKMIIYIIIVVILAIIGLCCWLLYQKQGFVMKGSGVDWKKITEIKEHRDFSCPGMTGFTFKYPVFKGWEVKKIEEIDNNECYITLNFSDDINLYISTIVDVFKDPEIGLSHLNKKTPLAKKNQNGVWYDLINKTSAPGSQRLLQFYGNDYGVVIRFTTSFPYEDEFFQNVIDSFKFVSDAGGTYVPNRPGDSLPPASGEW